MSKKILIKKVLWSKFFGSNKILIKKVLGPKKFRIRIKFDQTIFLTKIINGGSGQGIQFFRLGNSTKTIYSQNLLRHRSSDQDHVELPLLALQTNEIISGTFIIEKFWSFVCFAGSLQLRLKHSAREKRKFSQL